MVECQSIQKRGRAFLRWAGGKRWLVPRIEALFGHLSFNTYHEPFLGGGSFFFAAASGTDAMLSDRNDALIETYQSLKLDPERIIAIMRDLRNDSQTYYRVRGAHSSCEFERAAHFIYLNQTSFNGIYRVNLKGIYNVPFGNRTKQFLDESALRAASSALRRARLRACDFQDTLENISAGDLVFVDPPYTVSHNNNGFIKYNKSLFSMEDQRRLSRYINSLIEIGAKFILTNAAHPAIVEIFGSAGRKIEVSRASLIGGKQAQRGAVSEYVFTNIETAVAK